MFNDTNNIIIEWHWLNDTSVSGFNHSDISFSDTHLSDLGLSGTYFSDLGLSRPLVLMT